MRTDKTQWKRVRGRRMARTPTIFLRRIVTKSRRGRRKAWMAISLM